MNNFQFGERSIRELYGVDEQLTAVVHRALELSTVDFAVHDGIRTEEEQKALFDSGATKTLNSKHLLGRAVDLVPYINGKLRWEWGPIFKVAEAVRNAADDLKVDLTWGGAWDVNFTQSIGSPEDVMLAYSARRWQANKKPFLDGPHFELR